MKIILITSGLGKGKVKKAMDEGVYGCVKRPFKEKEIMAMIQHNPF
mgnify:CR=1 FL=1